MKLFGRLNALICAFGLMATAVAGCESATSTQPQYIATAVQGAQSLQSGKSDGITVYHTPAQQGLLFRDAYTHCYTDKLEIGIYADGEIAEYDWGGMGELRADPMNVIRVRVSADDVVVYSQNVLVTTDGFGNDTYHVLALTPYGWDFVVDMSFDHELGYLDGTIQFPIYEDGVLVDFTEAYELGEAVKCYFD